MQSILGGHPHCKRCGTELVEVPEMCPHCGFHPRDKGLKVAIWALIVVVVFVSIALVSSPFTPNITRLMLGIAGSGFIVSVTGFVLALLANPYRLGGLFTYRW